MVEHCIEYRRREGWWEGSHEYRQRYPSRQSGGSSCDCDPVSCEVQHMIAAIIRLRPYQPSFHGFRGRVNLCIFRALSSYGLPRCTGHSRAREQHVYCMRRAIDGARVRMTVLVVCYSCSSLSIDFITSAAHALSPLATPHTALYSFDVQTHRSFPPPNHLSTISQCLAFLHVHPEPGPYPSRIFPASIITEVKPHVSDRTPACPSLPVPLLVPCLSTPARRRRPTSGTGRFRSVSGNSPPRGDPRGSAMLHAELSCP